MEIFDVSKHFDAVLKLISCLCLVQVAQRSGVESMVAAMRAWSGQEGVQCNGCLALMSLVRGEGDVCQVLPKLYVLKRSMVP